MGSAADDASTNRAVVLLLLLLLVAVLGVGLVQWRADQQAQTARRRSLCLQEVEATAEVALLVPRDQVDEDGRLEAFRTLGTRLDAC